jgi:hypothetical protein
VAWEYKEVYSVGDLRLREIHTQLLIFDFFKRIESRM